MKPAIDRINAIHFIFPVLLLQTVRTRGMKTDLEMRVRPTRPDGLLFWVGEEEMSPYSDYFALGLRDGHVVAQYNLGSGEGIVVSNHSRIDDGRWHTIRVHRLTSFKKSFYYYLSNSSTSICTFK